MEVKGLDDFSRKLKIVQKRAPGLIIEKYDKAARDLKKKLKKATPYNPSGRYDGKPKTSKQHLRGRWKANRTKKPVGFTIQRFTPPLLTSILWSGAIRSLGRAGDQPKTVKATYKVNSFLKRKLRAWSRNSTSSRKK